MDIAAGVVELLYEGSIPPRRHIARIFGDQLGLEVHDVRPSCVFDEALIHEYQEAWAHLPRPWVVVNRKSSHLEQELDGRALGPTDRQPAEPVYGHRDRGGARTVATQCGIPTMWT